MQGSEIMNPDGKDKQIRRCGTCGHIVAFAHIGSGRCPECAGPVIAMGPISWTEEDEMKAMEDLDTRQDSEDFQDVVCYLWDKIEALDGVVDEKNEIIEELYSEIVLHKNAVKVADVEIKELKAKLADQTLAGKVRKSFGSTK